MAEVWVIGEKKKHDRFYISRKFALEWAVNLTSLVEPALQYNIHSDLSSLMGCQWFWLDRKSKDVKILPLPKNCWVWWDCRILRPGKSPLKSSESSRVSNSAYFNVLKTIVFW